MEIIVNVSMTCENCGRPIWVKRLLDRDHWYHTDRKIRAPWCGLAQLCENEEGTELIGSREAEPSVELKFKICPCGNETVSFITDDLTQARFCNECYPEQNSNIVLCLEKMNAILRSTGSLASYPLEERERNIKGDWTAQFQKVDINLGSAKLFFHGLKFDFSSRQSFSKGRMQTLVDYGQPRTFLFVDSPIFEAALDNEKNNYTL